ncbi:hypothetical protein ETT45_06575 [Streptococcus pyogenes]|nr:hypothetical protein AWU03_03260 [Streptococcus pyogenes]OAC63276.1 hypothetical protein AWU05_04000 [Streptococcus pyogenes]OAC64212.1 hypothetical protein AWU06_03645 [Streptococcus pyogenes]OAC73725.1 hypothetical protein AWU01_03550 [Streptococcus pyogenes]PWO36389.1 hypothetical protein DJ556_02400 [Streptococcus pyogenes]
MGMDISENKLLEGPLMTNEREKEEAKVALEELLHQIQVIHLELKIVRNWGYFVFLEMVCLSAGSNVVSKVNQLLIDLQVTLQNC